MAEFDSAGKERAPEEAELRAELDRIATSPVFRGAPQLAAFLNFVVKAALAGEADRIKGYTIATEALGRSANFDPQTDPIVRVEAGRLRRALARYYATEGKNDTIVIELPRGSYVPAFHRRIAFKDAAPPAETPHPGILAATGAFARHHARAGALMLAGAAVYAAVEFAFDLDAPFQTHQHSYSVGVTEVEATRQNIRIEPIVYIAPAMTTGTPVPSAIDATALRDRLIDAMGRFDDVEIVSHYHHPQNAESQAPDYELATTISYQPDGAYGMLFRLIDTAFGTVVWTKSFENLRVTGDQQRSHQTIVGNIAITLLQPLGVVQSHDRIKRLAGRSAHPHYRCVLKSYEYLRSYDPRIHGETRACLERAIAETPTFVSGHAMLARVYLREYQFDNISRPDDQPALDRALAAALRAIELNASSARAFWTLGDVHMARGEIEAALEAGRKSVALNPYDRPVLFNYGAHLVMVGEVDKGLEVLERLPAQNTVKPVRYEFVRFVAAYLKGDMAKADVHATVVSNPNFSPGYVARAIAASKMGDSPRAQAAIERLVAIHPGWREDPRGQLKKFFVVPAILNRFVADLAQAGLAGTAAAANSAQTGQGLNSGMPVVLVEPVAAAGGKPAPDAHAGLARKLRDALGRFETIDAAATDDSTVIPQRFAYRVTVTAEHSGGKATLTLRLIAVPDGISVWSRNYDTAGMTTDEIVADAASALAQPYGVIHAHIRARRVAGLAVDPRYACLMDALDAWPSFQASKDAQARECLERETAADPTFSAGFAELTTAYFREHLYGFGARTDGPAALDRALTAAQKAVMLNPQSARAHQALMEAHFHRGEIALARTQAATAIQNNPNDTYTLGAYGIRLIFMGEVETGMEMLRRYLRYRKTSPGRAGFAMFLGYYLDGDDINATLYANQITNDRYPLGLIARAITARKAGDTARTRRMLNSLVALNPAWRSDPHGQLKKFFPVATIADRLASDLVSTMTAMSE